MKGGSLYISLSKLVDSTFVYSNRPSIRSTENLIFPVEPIGRIFMPLCLLALWQFKSVDSIGSSMLQLLKQSD